MATLTTTISESVTLNGATRGSTNTFSVADIIDTFERIVTCPHSATTTIATFSANVYDSAGAIDAQGVKYIRVTNLSSTYDLELGVVGAASNYSILVPATCSHIIARADDIMLAEADTTPTFGSLADITSLELRPTASSDAEVEIFIASA